MAYRFVQILQKYDYFKNFQYFENLNSFILNLKYNKVLWTQILPFKKKKLRNHFKILKIFLTDLNQVLKKL